MIPLNALIGILLSLNGAGHAPVQEPVRIQIEPGPARWSVTYEAPRPVSSLAFAQSPDDSRSKTWRAAEGFEIVASEDGEALRRTDGGPFSRAEVSMAPVYRFLPNAYAPFSPSGDGGMTFHTGRLFACAETCDHEETWRMAIRTERPVMLDGELRSGGAEWTDRHNGRSVYVGDTAPISTERVVAVVDESLPSVLRSQLVQELPRFMAAFAGRLGELDDRPMLFFSYDIAHSDGFGHQGGTLPNQVFIHLYGAKWGERLTDPTVTGSLRWHFAHEAAHLYQRGLAAPDAESGWIHEGAAEAMAYLVVKEMDPDLAASKLATAHLKCEASLAKAASVREAISGGDFDAGYTCGLLIMIDLEKRLAARPGNPDLFDLWAAYGRRAGSQGSETAFLESVEEVGGSDLSEHVRRTVRSSGPLSGMLRRSPS